MLLVSRSRARSNLSGDVFAESAERSLRPTKYAMRSALAPDLPTLAESGLAGYEVAGWYGLAAPARAPAAIVRRLNAEANHVLKMPELATRLQAQGLEVVGGTSSEAAALIQRDVARWNKVIHEAGIARQ